MNAQSCIKGDIEYSVASYSDELFIRKYYGYYLDSLLSDAVSTYFCNTPIRQLPYRIPYKTPKGKEKEKHDIEPLFVDLATFNGIYAKRIWPVPSAKSPAFRSVRYRCGFYHYLFIVSGDRYIELTRNSVVNEKRIRKYLSKDFPEVEVLRMVSYFKDDRICDHYTFLPSFYIKRNDEIVFDSRTPPKPTENEIEDKDMNKYLVKRIDNTLWMTTNFNLELPGSVCYDSLEDSCSDYGRLYTWTAAREGCASLQDGWRLPTKDEWYHLSRWYGNAGDDSIDVRKRSFELMSTSGPNQFNALFGGCSNLDGSFSRMNAHGFYWTATEHEGDHAWFANFAKGSQSLYIENGGEKDRAFSVRCVKTVD